jgi:phosphate uptake regulator
MWSLTMDYNASDLERIERYATHARNNAISITGAARILRFRPPFETRAEDALRMAEVDLETALTAVRMAMAEYNTKPATA